MEERKEKVMLEIHASPEEVWNVISALNGVEKWFSSLISKCKVEGDKRFCETNDGIKFAEHVLELNHETRTFRFAIPQQDMLPVENIKETMQVSHMDNGNALVEWSATFDATDENALIGQAAFRQLWHTGLKEMEAFINSKN